MTAMALGTVRPLHSGLGLLGSVSKLILAQRAGWGELLGRGLAGGGEESPRRNAFACGSSCGAAARRPPRCDVSPS